MDTLKTNSEVLFILLGAIMVLAMQRLMAQLLGDAVVSLRSLLPFLCGLCVPRFEAVVWRDQRMTVRFRS